MIHNDRIHFSGTVAMGIIQRKVNWVLDANFRDFFDNLNHEGLVKFFEYRIADQRIVRLIPKWLSAGVLETIKRDTVKYRQDLTGV